MNNQKLEKDEYECAACHRVFKKGQSDEEAKTEAEGFFGKPVDEWKDEPAIVCDDCFNKMNPADNPEIVEYAKTKI